ncbi:MAG: hypothetical protein QW828_06855, partial [Candidatus Bathyarchaeia archaeon]
AARRPERVRLPDIRAGEYEALPEKLKRPEWAPDYGPAEFNAKSGATVIGARNFLIAYNVNLNTKSVRLAKEIAFEIRESFHGGNEGGSTIPPDIATCDECLSELRRPSDRRYRYFFITCTDCGPRYTITCKVPYDRYNTSMNCFQMCDECMEEYESPRDRRFHAQTNACPRCGPRLMIASSRGEPLACSDPISEAGRLLE